jgi:hypothetical protein
MHYVNILWIKFVNQPNGEGGEVKMDGNTLTIIIVGSLFILFSGIGLLLILLQQNSKKKAAKSLSWPEVTGTIIKSEVAVGESVFGGDDDQGQSQPMYSPEVSYTYQVGETLYTSNRISFAGKTSYSKPDKAEAVTRQFPEGSKVAVFYDPDKEDVAVLERSAKGSGVLLTAGIIFMSIGVITMIVGILILI